MASIAQPEKRPAPVSLKPDLWDRILSAAAIVLLLMVTTALARGQAEWHRIPLVVWGHIATIIVALVLTPVMLLRRRGDRLHRQLGWAGSGPGRCCSPPSTACSCAGSTAAASA